MLSMLFNQSVTTHWLKFIPGVNIKCEAQSEFLYVYKKKIFVGFQASRKCVWSLAVTTLPLWSLTMKFKLVLHEMHCKASRSRSRTQWRFHLPRNNVFFLTITTGFFFKFMRTTDLNDDWYPSILEICNEGVFLFFSSSSFFFLQDYM